LIFFLIHGELAFKSTIFIVAIQIRDPIFPYSIIPAFQLLANQKPTKRDCNMPSLKHSLMLERGGVISVVGAGGKTALMFRLARELSKSGDRVLTTTSTKIYRPTRMQSSIVIVSESAEAIAKYAREVFKRNSHISAGSAILHLKNKLKGLKPETIDALWQSGVCRWIIVEADGAAGRPLKAPALHEPVIPQSTHWLIGVVGLDAVGKPLTYRWAFRPQRVSKISGLASGAAITENAIADVLMDNNGIMKNSPPEAMRFAFLNQTDSQERLAIAKRIARVLDCGGKTGFTRVLIGQTLYEPFVKKYYP
jgi:probable selenium-dependent hydroxylase accessory protein YqeC